MDVRHLADKREGIEDRVLARFVRDRVGRGESERRETRCSSHVRRRVERDSGEASEGVLRRWELLLLSEVANRRIVRRELQRSLGFAERQSVLDERVARRAKEGDALRTRHDRFRFGVEEVVRLAGEVEDVSRGEVGDYEARNWVRLDVAEGAEEAIAGVVLKDERSSVGTDADEARSTAAVVHAEVGGEFGSLRWGGEVRGAEEEGVAGLDEGDEGRRKSVGGVERERFVDDARL